MRRALPSDPLQLLRETPDSAPPEDAFARIAARLDGLPAPAPIAETARGLTGRPSWGTLGRRFLRWSVAPLALGIAIGAGSQASLTSNHPPVAATPPSLPVPLPALVPPVANDEPAPPPAEPAATSPQPSARAPRSTLTDERILLDRARRQLASDEPSRALVFLEEHAQRFGRGLLSEEREAMRINVLVRLGRKDEAKTRGEAFAARFPNSIMGSSVRAALTSADASN